MSFCRKCGSQIEEGHLFCTKCGEPVSIVNNGVETQNNTAPRSSGEEKAKLNVGMLIWSIGNMLLCCFVAPMVLGIISLVFTILADGVPLDKACAYIKVSKILNIVASALAGAFIGLYIMIYVLSFLSMITVY